VLGDINVSLVFPMPGEAQRLRAASPSVAVEALKADRRRRLSNWRIGLDSMKRFPKLGLDVRVVCENSPHRICLSFQCTIWIPVALPCGGLGTPNSENVGLQSLSLRRSVSATSPPAFEPKRRAFKPSSVLHHSLESPSPWVTAVLFTRHNMSGAPRG
jgi:hypothetical protein